MSSEDQLFSFVIYSFFVYPIANYLVSPQRKYSRTLGVAFVILFLSSVSLFQLYLDNYEKGPNFYELFGVARDCSTSTLKKTFRSLSLELHPDKNRAAEATEQFRIVKHAYEVLVRPEQRRIYDLMGEEGLAMLGDGALDNNAVTLQLLVRYVSCAALVVFLTFFEASGESFAMGLFGLTVMLLMELNLLSLSGPSIMDVLFPTELFPFLTPYDVLRLMHKLFPSFVSGARCILSSLHVDETVFRLRALEQLVDSNRKSSANLLHQAHKMLGRQALRLMRLRDHAADTTTMAAGEGGIEANEVVQTSASLCEGTEGRRGADGLLARGIEIAKHGIDCEAREDVYQRIRETADAVNRSDFIILRNSGSRQADPKRDQRQRHEVDKPMTFFQLIRNLVVYLILFYMISVFKRNSTSKHN